MYNDKYRSHYDVLFWLVHFSIFSDRNMMICIVKLKTVLNLSIKCWNMNSFSNI
jgi:hypothetical protein